MKIRWIWALCASAAVIFAYGCGPSDCDVDIPCTPDTIVADDGNPADTTLPDGVGDVGGQDVRDDVLQDIIVTTDVLADVRDDVTSPDIIGTDVTADECVTDYDCTGCYTCTDVDGVMKCVDMTIYAGVAQCYDDVDCGEGEVCHFAIVGRPACGGYCDDGAAYSLHEWGVNVVQVDGSANMSAGPLKFYGAIVAKPVIYIYSDDQFTLDIGVHYNTGLATETWPEIPLSDDVVWEGIQVGTTECTTTATPQPDMSGMAEIDSREIYDLPEWVVAGANCLTFGLTISKVLFYTGPFVDYVPGLDAQMTVYADSSTAPVTITNSLTEAVGPVIAMYRYTESSCMDPSYCPVHTAKIGYAVIDSVAVGGPTNFDMNYVDLHVDATEEEPYPSVNGLLPVGWTSLPGVLKDALLTKGLTEAEATVFMTAWTVSMFGLLGEDSSWFLPSYTNGGFLIYLWPDSRTNEMLPLNAVPAPTTTARALVEYQKVGVVMPVTM